jgi:hypothetical protein
MTRISCSDRIIMLGAVVCFFAVGPASAFVTKPSPFVAKGSYRSYPAESSSRRERVWNFEAVPPNQEEDATTADMNPVTRASWYAVEAFGKVFGNKNDSSPTIAGDDIDLTKAPVSLEETLRRIQLDNDRSYFLSGNVDVLTYDPDCIFSDPFVSFAGKELYKHILYKFHFFFPISTIQTYYVRVSLFHCLGVFYVLIGKGGIALSIIWQT